jgi:hypothetical protein
MEPVSSKLYELESLADREREDAVRPGMPSAIAARKATHLLGINLSSKNMERLSLLFHYGLAIQWALIYPLLRRRTSLSPASVGLATGAAMSLIADELMTPALGFSAPNRAYPYPLTGEGPRPPRVPARRRCDDRGRVAAARATSLTQRRVAAATCLFVAPWKGSAPALDARPDGGSANEARVRALTSSACEADVDFAFHVVPLRGGAEPGHQLLERRRVSGDVLEPGEEVEGLVQIPAVVEPAGHRRQVLHPDGDVVGALLEQLPPLVLG